MTLVLPAGFAAPVELVAVARQPAGPSAPTGPEDPGGQGEDFGKSSPVALVLLIVFFVAVGLLVRSMTGHLKRLPASFDPPEQSDAAPPAGPERRPGP